MISKDIASNMKVLVAQFEKSQKELSDIGVPKEVCRVINPKDYLVLHIPMDIVNTLGLTKGKFLFWEIDLTNAKMLLSLKQDINNDKLHPKTSIIHWQSKWYAKIPAHIERALKVQEGDLFQWSIDLEKRRIILTPFTIESPYTNIVERSSKAYRGAPPREYITEITHELGK